MDKILIVFLIPTLLFAWDFTQERNTIPVEFNGVECQVPWTTGYSYINPTFCDLDGDNDYDLICGSDWNRQTLVRNDGDEFSWYFTFVSDNFIELNHPDPSSQITCRPAFCDVDNDSDFDLVFGGYDRLFFFRNEGNSQNYTFVLEEEDFQGIDFNTEYYPVFVDIDSDSDSDFFLGYGSLYTTYDGEISFYENIGTPDSMVLTLIEEEFMNIDLGDECIPAFCDIDNDGDYDMFLGDEDGLIHYYRNDGTPEIYD
ncbi:MAG: VCBS repeat-containing protein, partial [candidate division Zixibacteria bacterium]|nr:VCBS repeat-containing protein [Candidatus Tariuqbacter arcticus]